MMLVPLLLFVLVGSCLGNKRLLLDMVQNNPGDAVGFQQSKYHNPATQAALGYTGIVSTGENSLALAVNYSFVGDWVFPPGSVEREWLASYSALQHEWVGQVRAAGLGVFFFTDMIVFPRTLVSNYSSEVLTDGKIDFAKEKTKELLRGQFQQMFADFPETEGVVVRTGETYVYENPFHQGNSPIDTVKGGDAEKQKAWADFLVFLREEICVKYGKAVLFRTWDNFDGWTSSSEYYLKVTNQVPPHPLLYISVKHTAGDFYRFMKFNPQLGVGHHAQVVEVECQREYEGKGAFPNYVMQGVIDGFEESPGGLRDLIPSNPIVQGIWSWSRGGGWWGPYIKGNELWVDLHTHVLARWFLLNGTRSESDVFAEQCAVITGGSSETCSRMRTLALLSAKAMLYSHYCPEKPSSCWGWMRDDRLGGLDNVGKHISWVVSQHLEDKSIGYKNQAVALWRNITRLVEEGVLPAGSPLSRFVENSVRYGTTLSEIVAQGWTIMVLGTNKTAPSALAPLITRYDALWARYLTYRLVPSMPSLYHGYYFNLPSMAPASYSSSVPTYEDRWATPQSGMHASVDKFRA